MKHLFFSRSSGRWVTSAMPSSMVERSPSAGQDLRQGLLGTYAAELLAALDADQEVRRPGRHVEHLQRVEGREVIVVAINDPRLIAADQLQ